MSQISRLGHYQAETGPRAEAAMSPTDDDCIQQCLNGRPDAFRQLVLRYQRPMTSYLMRRLADPEAAAEVAQESFVRAYFRLNTLKKGDAFFSWLLGIAQRVMLETFRQRRRERPLSKAMEPAAPTNDDCTEDDEELAQAVAALPDAYRDVTVLRYFGGLSCAEVSGRLGVPIGTVTKRLSRAYQLLREKLACPGELPSEVRR